ncbi:hypothetical protein FRB96_008248 [Tulasnella sp. 330]|nr:hypothetical protein FRB96_008248 [Tulasnella sp. 330]KAG8877633.1 hypothetical protein FRB97_003225 [Tulasnella sp. 331]KAG8883067.1 hypothetical protein FRB98_003333 [Tulasnella sp. 332]
MPTNNSDLLQGLNLVHPPPTPASPTTDADILSAGPYADLAAQLDLWTNASFTSDEPFTSGIGQDSNVDGGEEKNQKDMGGAASEIIKRKRDILAGKKGIQVQQAMPALGHPSPYDLPALLSIAAAGNPFPAQSMNLNQLLALQAFPNPFHAAFGGGIPTFTQAPAFTAPPTMPASAAKADGPPNKRAKTRKTSATAPSVSARTSIAPSEAADEGDDDRGDQDDDGESSSRPGNMTEDKRRRNTQASARFRLKKKEREHAMEIRSKELETKVGELEKECEALRRENGWLKGLVVGVTGGSGMPMSTTMPTGPMALPASLSSTTPAASSKRKRSDAAEP